MLARAVCFALWKKRIKRLARDRKGIAALEFSMIMFPFFILLFGLIEIAIIFLYMTTLDWGMASVGREIRTGQIQTAGGITNGDLKTRVCGDLFGLMDCDSKLNIQTVVLSEFSASSDTAAPLDSNGDLIDPDETLFATVGGPNDIVMVRVMYEYQLITPILSLSLDNMGDGARLLSSSLIFRNEPY